MALLMGEGGYVPASAESTWSRRFGDCKAKTALLLGILHELQIDAVPAAVNSRYGDALPGRLPMLSLFDHVLVRASINGKSYWLDGTRTEDLSLDKIDIPSFGWVLPLVPKAELVPLTETPLDAPSMDTVVSIDASAGVFAPAPFKAERILRGDVAKSYQQAIAAMTSAQLEQSLRDYWREIYDYVTISSATFSHDKDRGELKLSMSGEARIDWDDGWYYVPHSGLAYEPDLDRAPGPDQAAPWAVGFPSYDRSKVTIRLPSGFSPGQSKSLTPVKETLAGIEYFRTAEFKNSVFTMEKSERSLKPEITHAEALATQARLKALANEDVYLRVPEGYRITDKDIQAKAQEKPSSAKAFISRGLIFLDKKKYDEAIADFSEANKLAPQDAWPLANRGLAYAWKRDFPAAEEDLAAAEAVQPDNKVAFRARGLVSELKGNLAEALTIYDKILNRDPDDSFVRLRRAGIRMQQERREEALADLNAVIAGDTRNASALAQRAFIAASKEDWAAAEKDLAAALAADPENAAVLATKAMIAMQRRDYASARDLASEALKRDPTNDFARYLHAQLLKRENGGKASMQAFDEAVARDPKDPSALLIRAFANIDEKNFDAAEKDIAAALAIAPAEPRAIIARGYLATARGDNKGAIKAYTAALAAAPGNGPILARRADAYRQNGDYDLAFADTEAALKSGMISPSLRLQRVNILVSKGDLAAASAEADKLIAENPTSEFALVAAGKTYAVIGEREKAIATIDKALALNAVPYIYINRADVRAESEREAKIADLDAALNVDPKYEDAMAAKASLLSKSGKHAEAIELYDQAIKLALNSDHLKFRRGIALERAGRRAEAEQAFDAERARSKTADDFKRQCWTKATNDVALQAALDDCKTALRLDPNNRGLNETLGMALLKLRKDREAITAYDKAIAEKSGASSYMGRAIARARLGDKDGAHSDAQEARKLRPYIDDTFEGYGLKTTAELADR